MGELNTILVVEGNSTDAMSMKEGIEACGIDFRVVHAVDSDSALDILRDRPNQRPRLIILGVHARGVEGLGFLRAVKSDDQTKGIPVVVFADYRDQRCVEAAFGLGTIGYMVKTPDPMRTSQMIRRAMDYWRLSMVVPTGSQCL